MTSPELATGLRYLPPTRIAIAGTPCEGMTIRAATQPVGRLQGFIVDPEGWRLRYFVVRTSNPVQPTALLPINGARIDVHNRAIELLEADELSAAEPFSPGRFPSFSEEDLLVTHQHVA